MNKNVKRMFLITTLMILLWSIMAVSATDIDDNNINEVSSSTIESNSIDESSIDVNKNIEPNKNIKQAPETSVDYYVSDADGNDENDGSQTSPFKTINTAISKTDAENSYNIHILEGTYKGEGNTNLTVNGEYFINFIGDGVDKTIIDGELNYTLPDDPGFVWDSSEAWWPWRNCSGNWFMNITAGNGSFEITNFKIQNCYSVSGTEIAASPTATIDNYANLKATDMYFYHNSAGVGAGIRNGYKDFNNNATLYVDNCTFEANLKSTTYGNFGAAVYNNATAIINNSFIIDNYARWGSLTTDKSMYVYNTYLARNIGYDGTSTYKNGPTIYANTGNANFYNPYGTEGLLLHVENCTFEDNQHVDITYGNVSSEIINNVFNHSTGIYITAGVNASRSQVIANNQFIDMQPSSLTTSMSSKTKPSWSIYNLGSIPLLIENNTIDVKDTLYGYGIYTTNNATIINNTLNNYIYLNGKNNTIKNNYIDAPVNFVIQGSSSATNNTIANNTLYSNTAKGDVAVNVAKNNVVSDNKPIIGNYVITDETYPQYFDENGFIKIDVVESKNKITFSGDLINKKFIFDNIDLIVTAEPTSKLINATIVSQNNASLFLQNIKIENTNNIDGYTILLNSTKNTMQNVSVTVDTDEVLQAIKIEEDLNIITNCTINITAAAGDTVWNADWSIGNVPTAGVFIRSSNNLVNNTKIWVDGTRVASGASYPSVDGLDIQSKAVGEYVSGNEIRNTRINVTGGSYVYGLNVARAQDTYTTLTYYDVTSNFCAYAVQIGDSKDNQIAGYIYSKADSQAYGAYITAMATGKTYNTHFSKLYIQGMDAPEVFGIYVDGASGLELANATYILAGGNVRVVDIHKDWMDNAPENIFINALKITVTNDNDESMFMVLSNSNNVTITNSNMTSTAGKAINLTNVTNATVVSNYINAANIYGGNAAVITTDEAVIENNTPVIALLTDDTYSSLFDENGNCISDASVISLAGDLHNKDLIFDKNTTVNITNVDDYTIFEGTIKLCDLDSESPSTTQTSINIIGINFNNTNKSVFKDEMADRTKRTIKFVNSTFDLNGEDMVAFISNNDTPISLEVSTSNITMNGNNVAVTNFNGLNRTQILTINSNIINLTAINSAIIINASKVSIQFNRNNVTQKATESTIANLNNCTISSYNFRYNIIQSEGDSVKVLDFFKNDTTSSYISDNNMTLTSSNPITAINVTGARSAYVQNNNIIVNAENGEVPVIYSNATTSVQNNYILAYDVAGNDAVITKGTNTKNSPNATTPTQSSITVEDITAKLGEIITITAFVTDAKNNSIPRGTVIFVDSDNNTLATVDVVDGQASFDVTYNKETQLEINAKFTNNNYFTDSECVFNLKVAKEEVNITLDDVTFVPSKTATLTARVVDSEGNNITTGKVIFKVNGKTVKDANGKVIYAKVTNGVATADYIVPSDLANKNVTVTAKYMGSTQYDAAEVEQSVSVGNKQATIVVDEIADAKVGTTVSLKANITDGDNNPVNGGKVVFKVNGKTVKDANGKIIYAKVVNGTVTVDYDLSSLKAKTYTLTAVFIAPSYDRADANSTLTVIN